MPRLAILDDYQGLAPARFEHLKARGVDIASFPETLNPRDPAQKAALIERLQPFDIVVTMRERTPLPADVIAALPNLKLLLTTGRKNASLDLDACRQRGITVAGTTGQGRGGLLPEADPDSTTQHTWALILGLARHIARDDAAVKAGGWQGSLATGLPGKTLGLLGLGRLGTATARIAVLAFSMKVIAWSMNLTQDRADEAARQAGLPAGTFEVVSSKLELFRRADILSVHYVLSPRSRGLVGRAELDAMKPTALLVNTSRGPIIDEAALLEALHAGRIRGAALDVFDAEPLPADSPWRTTAWGRDGRSEVLLTPHTGYCEEENMERWYDEQAENLERWLDGQELRTRLV